MAWPVKSATKNVRAPLLAAEGAGAEATFVVPVEDDAHVLQVDEFRPRLGAHILDGVLVAQVIAALDGVEGVVFPAVAAVGQGGVDAPLGGVGVAADGVNLADDGHVGPALMGGQRRSHAGEAGPDYQNIVL